MARILNYHAFNIFELEKAHWDYGYHSHNFYEIVLIEGGSGKHRLNDILLEYSKGDIFLLSPADRHEFIIDHTTRFIYIKFTETYLLDTLMLKKDKTHNNPLWMAIAGKPILTDRVRADEGERTHIFQLTRMLLSEFNNNKQYSRDIISSLFHALLSMMVRQVNPGEGQKTAGDLDLERIERILGYIRVHTLDRQKMTIRNLASEFLMSPNYISVFMKKHTGISIQNHIIRYKVKAAERLLRNSGLTVGEIALKLGFNDSSHLHRTFKGKVGTSPKDFRTKALALEKNKKPEE